MSGDFEPGALGSGFLGPQLGGVGGAPGGGTLASVYAAGANAFDQTMVLLDAKGGGILIDASSAGFTGVEAFTVGVTVGGPTLESFGISSGEGIVLGPYSIVIGQPGHPASSTAPFSVAIGADASIVLDHPGASRCIAIGSGASIPAGDATTVLGANAQALRLYSLAVGYGSHAEDGGATLGSGTSATGGNSTAVGFGATANGLNGMAFGNGSVAGASQIVFGNAASNSYTLFQVEGAGAPLFTFDTVGLSFTGTIIGVTTAITGVKNNALVISIPTQGTADADGVGLTIAADAGGSGGTGNHVGGNITLTPGAGHGTGAAGIVVLNGHATGVTEAPGTNNTTLATTAFVTAAIPGTSTLSAVLAAGNTTGAHVISMADGAVGAPELTWSTDLTCGLYHTGMGATGSILAAINGVNVATLTATSVAFAQPVLGKGFVSLTKSDMSLLANGPFASGATVSSGGTPDYRPLVMGYLSDLYPTKAQAGIFWGQNGTGTTIYFGVTGHYVNGMEKYISFSATQFSFDAFVSLYSNNGGNFGSLTLYDASGGMTFNNNYPGARYQWQHGGVVTLMLTSTALLGIGCTPTNILSLNNGAAQKFWIENSATDVVGRALTVAAGGTIAGTSVNDVVGGNLLLEAGLATGAGTSRILLRTGKGLASGKVLQTMTTWVTLTEFGSLITAPAALATSATDGDLYIPTCAGPPSGVPTAQTGTVPLRWDSTNKKLYVYDGSWLGGTLPGTWT